MSSSRINRSGLSDAQPFLPDAEYVKKGAEFSSLTGIAMTHLGNGDIFYAVDPSTGGNITVTLPNVGDSVGQTHIIKRNGGGSNACKIVAADSGLLDGSATHSIAAQQGVRAYFSDGEQYRSIGSVGGDSGEIDAGFFTPTLTGVANLDALTAVECQYLRVRDFVTVSGQVNADPTVALGTQTDFLFSLPVASAFTQARQLGGAGSSSAVLEPVSFFADVATGQAGVRFFAQTAVNHAIQFLFSYKVL